MENHGARALTAYDENLIKRLKAALNEVGAAKAAVSVILTGSLPRGEATRLDGKLLSDVELAVVYSGLPFKVKRLAARMAPLFKEELNIMPLSLRRVRRGLNYNGGALRPKKLTIFTCDLYNGGRVIWGKDVLDAGRADCAAVDIYEAKRLTANRIGDMLTAESGDAPRQRCKLALAVADAWLLLGGSYKPFSAARKELLDERRAAFEADFGADFASLCDGAYAFLRGGGPFFDVPESALRAAVLALEPRLEALRRCRVNCLSRRLKIRIKYILASKRLGPTDIENAVFSRLIADFAASRGESETAELWRKVLY